MKPLVWTIPFLLLAKASLGQSHYSMETYRVPAAGQAVAVDDAHVYAINNTALEKYARATGKLVRQWRDTTGTFKHLNSGVILDGKLYCAHSNFPDLPMASSIEIFDPATLEPIGSHSFGIDTGSATWIGRQAGSWYVAFAHYERFKAQTGKDNTWTQLVRYTPDWKRTGGWILPKELIQRFGKMSNSGGAFAADGRLYLTGHDLPELYVIEFPQNGYALKWINTLAVPFEGQGIAIDPGDSRVMFGIKRSSREIIQIRWEK